MDRHTPFILASYALTALVIGGIIVSIIAEHIRLKRALSRFPAREQDRDTQGAPNTAQGAK